MSAQIVAPLGEVVSKSLKLAGETVGDVLLATRKFGGSRALDWEGLQHVEMKRRFLLPYSDKRNLVSVLSRYSGTVVPALLASRLNWVCITIYVVVRALARSYRDSFPPVEFINMGMIGYFLSFVLVTFVSHSHARFQTLYHTCMGSQAMILDLATLSKTYLSAARARRVVRYANAAHLLAYVGMSNTYNVDNFLQPLNEKLGLLSEEEYRRVIEINPENGGICFGEVINWIFHEITSAFKKEGQTYPLDYSDTHDTYQLYYKLYGLRNNLGALFRYADQPYSFFHIHLIYTLAASYLPLFAYTSAVTLDEKGRWLDELVSVLLVLVVCGVVLGLRELGQNLFEPFGSDYEDLSVLHYVNFTCQESFRILNGSISKPLDNNLEARLAGKGEPIGEPWETDKYLPTDNEYSTYEGIMSAEVSLDVDAD